MGMPEDRRLISDCDAEQVRSEKGQSLNIRIRSK